MLRAAHLLGGQRHRGEVERLGQPGLGTPVHADEHAGVSANCSRACLRVWSMVGSGVRVRPAASPSTAKSVTPPQSGPPQ